MSEDHILHMLFAIMLGCCVYELQLARGERKAFIKFLESLIEK